jgi:mono/diheme cytochrome c family protein
MRSWQAGEILAVVTSKGGKTMRRDLLRVLVAGVVLVGLVGFCSGSSQAQNAGESLFKTKCAACHGADGTGEVPMGKKLGARNLSSAEVQGQSDAQLTDVVTKGKNKMPAYDGKLTKEQIGQLVAYIRELGKKH